MGTMVPAARVDRQSDQTCEVFPLVASGPRVTQCGSVPSKAAAGCVGHERRRATTHRAGHLMSRGLSKSTRHRSLRHSGMLLCLLGTAMDHESRQGNLSCEEYIEQAYFFRVLRERLAENVPTQDV